MKKSQDFNAKDAIKAIKGMSTIAEVNEFVSEEAETKNRKTVFDAAKERGIELSAPADIKVDPVESEETTTAKGEAPSSTDGEDPYAQGISLGRVHGDYMGPEHNK